MIIRNRGLCLAIAALGLCVAAGADETDDEPRCVIEHPARGAVYTPTSDIIVVGSSRGLEVGVAQLQDARKVVQQSASFRMGGYEKNGAWLCPLRVPRGGIFRAGIYRLEVRPVRAPPASVPVQIVADPDGPKEPQPLPRTEIGTSEYGDLPRLRLAAITLSDSDSDEPKLSDRATDGDKSIGVNAGAEFAVEGWFLVPEPPEFVPCDVVLSLRDKIRRTKDGGGKDEPKDESPDEFVTATVAETIAKIENRDGDNAFDYLSVMRAPNRRGKFTLEAVYRRVVIASATVEIEGPQD